MLFALVPLLTITAMAPSGGITPSIYPNKLFRKEFARGLSGEYTLDNFPAQGQSVTVEWRHEQQNFVITGVE